MAEPFDLTDVHFVQRVVIGSARPEEAGDPTAIERQMERLNRLLEGPPRGVLIGKDRGFHVLRFGDQQVVLEYVAYHVGFQRKPYWLDELDYGAETRAASAPGDAFIPRM